MAFLFQKDRVDAEKSSEGSGNWYADPYGDGARRWYDDRRGWTDRVEGAGQQPDKTGVTRTDEAAVTNDSVEHSDPDGKPAPLSRPVDAGMLGRASGNLS
jgi:hypothetical protein